MTPTQQIQQQQQQSQPVISPVKSILKNSHQQPLLRQQQQSIKPIKQSNVVSVSHTWPPKRITDPIQRTQLQYKYNRAKSILTHVSLSIESYDIHIQPYTAQQLYHEALYTQPTQLCESSTQTHHNNQHNDTQSYHNCKTELCYINKNEQMQT